MISSDIHCNNDTDSNSNIDPDCETEDRIDCRLSKTHHAPITPIVKTRLEAEQMVSPTHAAAASPQLPSAATCLSQDILGSFCLQTPKAGDCVQHITYKWHKVLVGTSCALNAEGACHQIRQNSLTLDSLAATVSPVATKHAQVAHKLCQDLLASAKPLDSWKRRHLRLTKPQSVCQACCYQLWPVANKHDPYCPEIPARA